MSAFAPGTTPGRDPPVSPALRAVTWLEVVILAWAGGGLLFHPPWVTPVWPWALAPFNTRYLGALYLAALVAAFLQARSGRWSPARVVTPMIFVFTLVVTIYSFVHIDRFDPARVETWIWFLLYVGVCANAFAHLVAYRAWSPPDPATPTRPLRAVLVAQVALLGAYGAAMLVAPAWASAGWPWKLDAFHAQLYSVTFLTPAAGALVLLRGASSGERVALGLTQAGWGALPIVGLLLADAIVHRVDWSATGTWLWIAGFAAIALVGAWTAAEGMRHDARQSTT